VAAAPRGAVLVDVIVKPDAVRGVETLVDDLIENVAGVTPWFVTPNTTAFWIGVPLRVTETESFIATLARSSGTKVPPVNVYVYVGGVAPLDSLSIVVPVRSVFFKTSTEATVTVAGIVPVVVDRTSLTL